jgi:hypothetical protein
MNRLSDTATVPPIASMLTGIDPNEVYDAVSSDDGCCLPSTSPNTVKTPTLGRGRGSHDSSASDTTYTATADCVIFN